MTDLEAKIHQIVYDIVEQSSLLWTPGMEKRAEAAIHTLIEEVIGPDEPEPPRPMPSEPGRYQKARNRNDLRAEQRARLTNQGDNK